MKTKLTLIVIGLTSAFFSQSQPILSGVESFETWTTAESAELPTYWDGFNRTILFEGMPVGEVACIEKDSSDPKDGDYSVKITSKSIMGGPAVPGILTAGDFIVDWETRDGDIEGGVPFTSKPERLVGWYKYDPIGNDTALVSVWFLQEGRRVGQGSLKLTSNTADWLSFSVDISYEPGAVPDSMNMIFMSTIERESIADGSIFEIDAIGFESTLSLNDRATEKWKIYPNPTSDYVIIEGELDWVNTIRIFDLAGRICIETAVNSSVHQYDISHLDAGIYLLKLNGLTATYSSTLIVK